MSLEQSTEQVIVHAYNRGVEKRDIFSDDFDHARFVECLELFNSTRHISVRDIERCRDRISGNSRDPISAELVDIIGYCLMPNHFHLVLREKVTGGISKFLQKMSIGYTGYFNTKYQRSGVLLQGATKKKELPDDESLLYVLAYVHLNPVLANIARKPEDYKWSNYRNFLTRLDQGDDLFDLRSKHYIDFVQGIAEYKKERKHQDLLFDFN